MKKTSFLNCFGMVALLALATFVITFTVSCSDDDIETINPQPELPTFETDNPSSYITDSTKLAMIRSMKDLSGDGRIYEINYTADYKLQQVIDRGATQLEPMFQYIAYLLFDNLSPSKAKVSFGAGCSAFAAPDPTTGNYFMGRNYDFRHATADGKGYVNTAAIVVHTAPAGGKRSISIVDGKNLGYERGFYSDNTTDISMLMGLPYAALDGINEDGFCIGVLALSEKQTNQNTGKKRIGTTTAIRMLLDRVSTVNEAIKMLGEYDMDMRGQGRSNYHFFMADATGDYAIVEYTFPKGDSIPTRMEVFKGNDTTRCVTNFYVSPTMVGTNDGWQSTHGKQRYLDMRSALLNNNYALRESDAWSLLQKVAQKPTDEITSQTQWSALYNLSEKTLRLAILRDYAKEYNFKIK